MKPNTLILLILLLSNALLLAQPTWPPQGKAGVDFNIKDSKGQKQGLWYRSYENGDLYYSGTFKDNKPASGATFYYYFEGGELMSIHKFRSDPSLVDAEIYFKTGQLQGKGKYLNQKKDSIWSFFDEKHHLISEEMFVNDLREGKTRIYYTDGKLMHDGEYKADQMHGSFVEYFPDHKKRAEGTCLDGLYEGKVTQYLSNGLKLSEGKYIKGIKEGEWLFYLENGKLELQALYRGGTKTKEVRHNGDFLDYYPSGIPKLDITYKNGLAEGPFKEFYDKGEFMKEQKPAEGPESTMEWVEKLGGTQIMREGEYKGGELSGDVVYYTIDGIIEKKETYENGVFIK